MADSSDPFIPWPPQNIPKIRSSTLGITAGQKCRFSGPQLPQTEQLAHPCTAIYFAQCMLFSCTGPLCMPTSACSPAFRLVAFLRKKWFSLVDHNRVMASLSAMVILCSFYKRAINGASGTKLENSDQSLPANRWHAGQIMLVKNVRSGRVLFERNSIHRNLQKVCVLFL